MTINEYQEAAARTAIYPGRGTQRGLEYAVMGLCGEAGELANKVKKLMRGDKHMTDEIRADLIKETGDVGWYCAAIAHELGATLDEAFVGNVEKLAKRAAEGRIKGDGDNR